MLYCAYDAMNVAEYVQRYYNSDVGVQLGYAFIAMNENSRQSWQP